MCTGELSVEQRSMLQSNFCASWYIQCVHAGCTRPIWVSWIPVQGYVPQGDLAPNIGLWDFPSVEEASNCLVFREYLPCVGNILPQSWSTGLIKTRQLWIFPYIKMCKEMGIWCRRQMRTGQWYIIHTNLDTAGQFFFHFDVFGSDVFPITQHCFWHTLISSCMHHIETIFGLNSNFETPLLDLQATYLTSIE